MMRYALNPSRSSRLWLLIAALTVYAAPAPLAQTAKPLVLEYEASARAGVTEAVYRFWSLTPDQPIRAILVLNGEGRKNADDPLWQEFARANHLALVACLIEGEYIDAPAGSGNALEEALAAFARQTSHPEIASAPLLLYGASAGGEFNYNFVIWKPQRVMAFIVNKGGYYNQQQPDPQAYSVPGFFILGLQDEQYRIDAVTSMYTKGRQKGALWALAPQPASGHEFSKTPALARTFFQSVLQLRLPESSSRMNPLNESQGWLGNLTTHDIQPATGNSQSSRESAWLPNQASAEAWKKFVLSDGPLPHAQTAAPPVPVQMQPTKLPVETLVIDGVEKPSVDGAELPDASIKLVALVQTAAAANPAGNAGTALAFDVVSIKPSGGSRGGFGLSPSGYSATQSTLYTTLMMAYFPMTRMFGYSTAPVTGVPEWVNKDMYDIDAKLDEQSAQIWKNLTVEQRWEKLRPLLKAMLAERCKLAAHMTMVDAPVYELVIGKHGPKMKETAPGEAPPEHAIPIAGDAMMVPIYPKPAKEQLTFFNTSMAALAMELSTMQDRQVVDRTGLTGKYDFAVPRVRRELSDEAESGAASDPNPNPFIWDVSEAGLELRPAKAPQPMLVIDHIEKPTAN